MTSADILFKLIGVALGKVKDLTLPSFVNWKEVIELSYEHGVAAIAVDGLQMIYEANPDLEIELDMPMSEDLKYEWFGSSLVAEQDYENCFSVIKKLASFYSNKYIDLLLLKGYDLSLNYPVPSHRPTGDIDIYLFGEWERADEAINKDLNIKVDNSHHHHSVFKFDGYSVENHYDFINVNSHWSNKKIEFTFKSLAKKELQIHHCGFYLPSADLNALFVSRHCAIHFAAEKMIIKQILDWALLVEKHNDEIDWNQFWSESEKMGMIKFVLCMDAIAIDKLGFDSAIFHIPSRFSLFSVEDASLVTRVLNDIINPEYREDETHGTIKYLLRRCSLWWHNRWKHRIVYSDSLISTFFAQIKSHMMKPATIVGK